MNKHASRTARPSALTSSFFCLLALLVRFQSRIRYCTPNQSRGSLSSWHSQDFGYKQITANETYEDNLACVAMRENSVRRKFLRHIDICRYSVLELVNAGFVKLIPLRTRKFVTDALTKSLPSPALIGHCLVMMGQKYVLLCSFCILNFSFEFIFIFIFLQYLWISQCIWYPHCAWGEQYNTHRPLSHESVHERPA